LKEQANRESVGKTALVLDRLLQTPTQHYKQHFTTLVFTFTVSGNVVLWRIRAKDYKNCSMLFCFLLFLNVDLLTHELFLQATVGL